MARKENEKERMGSAGLTWSWEQLLRSCWADWLAGIRVPHPTFQAAVKIEGCRLGHKETRPEAHPFRAVGVSPAAWLWSEAWDIRYTSAQMPSLFKNVFP